MKHPITKKVDAKFIYSVNIGHINMLAKDYNEAVRLTLVAQKAGLTDARVCIHEI